MIPARDCRQHNSRHISLFTDKQTSRPWNTLKAEVGLLLLYGLAKALEMSVLVLVWTCCYTNHLGCPRFYHIFRNPGFNWNLQIVIFCSVKAISDFFFFYIKLHLKFWPSLESALLCLASHLPLYHKWWVFDFGRFFSFMIPLFLLLLYLSRQEEPD